jgi:hypothetical protein
MFFIKLSFVDSKKMKLPPFILDKVASRLKIKPKVRDARHVKSIVLR